MFSRTFNKTSSAIGSCSSQRILVVFTFALLTLFLAAPVCAQAVKLDRDWELLTDPTDKLRLEQLPAREGWRATQAGLSWNAQHADLRDYMGVAWYRTRFSVPQLNDGKRALIKFGAVDYFAEVYVNGRKVGEHEGGYTPFTFDVTEFVKPEANTLLVRVVDPPMDEEEGKRRFPDMLYKEIPHGKQNWYVQTGGIWQPVTLEIKPETYIKRVHATPLIDGSVTVRVETNQSLGPMGPVGPASRMSSSASGAGRDGRILDVQIADAKGNVTTLRSTGGGQGYVTYAGKVESVQLWNLASPNLYTVTVRLGDDIYKDSFGFRSFESRDGKFYLNGEPFYMIGALDQDFYPETIYTTPSKEYVRDQMLKAKRLGLNLLRTHIKVPDPVYLEAADEVGMLIWYEIPCWNDFNHFSPKAAARGMKTLEEMTARDWNHPSIVIQSVINESWGANLKEKEQREWLHAAYLKTKEMLAPRGMLVVDNSACCDNFHVATDIEDNHRYNSIPDEHQPFDRWVADFATRPRWNFSPFGDAKPTGNAPLVLSEFGNWGLPELPAQLPWWFGRDFASREVTRPAGTLERFTEYNFKPLFGDFNRLAIETQRHQFTALKHEIEEIRRHAPIQGYVITELTDINWEVNGLMDIYRNPKVYAADLAKLQQPDVLLARFRKQNYMSGEEADVQLLLSHYSGRDLRGAEVRWQGMKQSGVVKIDRAVEQSGVTPLGVATFRAPVIGRAGAEQIKFEVRGRDGALIAENSYNLYIYPPAESSKDIKLVFHDPARSGDALLRGMRTAGYNITATQMNQTAAISDGLLLATKYDDSVAAHLRNGGRALLILNSSDALPDGFALRVTPRAGSDLDGNWVTNFNWARIDTPPFQSVGFNKILGFEAASVTPRHIIQGVPGGSYDDVMAGIFYGWLNNNAALAVGINEGRGRMLLTTFRFDELGSDPYATRLFDEMIRHVASPSFAPKLNASMIRK